MTKNLYFVARQRLLEVRCIVAVHTKSPLRSIEDRKRNEKGSGRVQKLRIFVRTAWGQRERRGIANASGGGRARLSRAKNAGEKRERAWRVGHGW